MDDKVVCYCPGRFDRLSLFAGVLDSNAGDRQLDLLEADFAQSLMGSKRSSLDDRRQGQLS